MSRNFSGPQMTYLQARALFDTQPSKETHQLLREAESLLLIWSEEVIRSEAQKQGSTQEEIDRVLQPLQHTKKEPLFRQKLVDKAMRLDTDL